MSEGGAAETVKKSISFNMGHETRGAEVTVTQQSNTCM